MRQLLVPCPSCSRHVRVCETACPFCRASLPASLRATAAPEPPRARLARAALFAFAASAATAAATACGGQTAAGPPGSDTDASEIVPGADAAGDALGVQAIYGAPAEADGSPTGEPTDGGAAPTDALAAYDGPMAIAAYGIQPIDSDAEIHVEPPYGGVPIH
jgi:hypothetical protein